jgi:hypothetical protein
MTNVLKKAFIIIAAAASTQTSFAQNNIGQDTAGRINTITTAVPFLLIAPDARGGGLGDAGVASTPDANSIHWNASKLAFAEKELGVSISYTPWLKSLVPDINLGYLSGYKKIGKDQAIATSLLYFSLGDIVFTDQNGATIGNFRPHELAYDIAYARKLSDNFSGGLALRYIYSNLTGGITVNGADSKAGKAVAADLSFYYRNNDLTISDKKSTFTFGTNISNIGSKISYTETQEKDFIPINLKLGSGLLMNLDDYNQIQFLFDINKLLVPTPPIYDTITGGAIKYGLDGRPIILAGKDPNRPVASGIFGSFSDAPDGGSEELNELSYSLGMEYWYDKLFALRVGYFYEHPTKGNRKFFTLGAGLKYNVFGLDFAYLIPTQQHNPLQNTLRFTLSFDFDAFKSQNKPSENP